jgi:hypothetical protein
MILFMLKRHIEPEELCIGRLLPVLPMLVRRQAGEMAMTRGGMLVTTAAALIVWTTLGAGGAAGQTAKDIEGSWKLASATVTREGKTRDIFGPRPSGTIIFDAGGRFAQVIVSSDLPKFASKSRETGTADENKAVVQGSIAYFGTYSVGSGGIVNLHIENSTFPNMTGTDQQRSVKISGDDLTWGNATPAVGSGIAEQLWRRAK